ncbi:hypothetical protein Pcinc_004819 [Petrolisthes cinctipes]|uniref:Uncharacterized protein n=1 Tax=Petrolisthes cinctipes TaxID=88211 RepID=A0AAE1GGH9_PETCI|nr:hypothetical protein Pcinc_007662 [Petrolisthes cinctipes]KAK3891290.1 hypothetical protein Pcinc_004805 [Petrolisthes cinctipes]KAK3891292.1 hypothetical protein Pcinc_004807 [Petrolisthes cinctipes]KAK3891299.1 hypothetical protein Pcinc_004814 [Petrolisthes cinctipes]KAK3891304.1 hypothetical protein Pcinc_004819 [Petrolisthes cinctipes]
MGTGVAGETNSGGTHSWSVGALESSSGGKGGRVGIVLDLVSFPIAPAVLHGTQFFLDLALEVFEAVLLGSSRWIILPINVGDVLLIQKTANFLTILIEPVLMGALPQA